MLSLDPRYSRHYTLPSLGIAGQQMLQQAKVACIGAGGLGNPVLLYLAAAGVGTLAIMDGDAVELSNLQRQILFVETDVGYSKAERAAAHLQARNSQINVISHPVHVTSDNAITLLQSFDVIVDATDNFASRYLINDVCIYLDKPVVQASIYQFEGHCAVFARQTGCYRCLYPTPPIQVMNCEAGGVLGVLPGILGSIQANEVLKLILNIGQPLYGRLLRLDALSLQIDCIDLMRDPQCVSCAQPELLALKSLSPLSCLAENKNLRSLTPQEFLARLKDNSTQVVDVREAHEREIDHLGGRLIPLSTLSSHIHTLDPQQPVYLYCQHDLRSQQAAQLLNNQNFKTVYYLAGGLENFRNTLGWVA